MLVGYVGRRSSRNDFEPATYDTYPVTAEDRWMPSPVTAEGSGGIARSRRRTSRAGDTELYRSARPGLALPPRAPRAGAILLSPAVKQRTKCFYITVLLD